MSDLIDLSELFSTNDTSTALALGAIAIVIFALVLAFLYLRANAHFEYKLQLKGDHEDLLRKVQNLEIELKEKQSLKEDVEKKTARIKSEYEQFAANKEAIDQVKGQLNALGSEYQGKLQQLQDLDRELSKSEALKDFINNHQQEQLDALDQKINDKEERLKELSDQVNEKLSSGIAKDSLNQMFSELADNSNLKSESQKLQQEIEDLRKQYDVNAARLIEQEKELNTGKLNDAINKAFTSFNEQAVRAQQEQELSSKLEQLSQQVQEKEEKLSELKEEISNKSNQNQLSDALNTAFEQLSDTNDFRKLTSQLNELKNNVAAKQKELDDLQSQVNEQQSNNLLSETLGQTFDDLKDTLSQSMQNLASELGEQSLLTAQKNQLKQEVFALEKAKSDQASAAKALQKELNDLKAQLDEQRSSSQISEALSNAISSINGQNELNDQQRVLNNKLDDLKRQISKKQDELDDLQSQVDEQRSSSQISEALSNAIFSISGQNELNDQQRVLNNKLDDLKRQISKKQDELDDLQSQVNEQQSTNLLSETLGQAFDDLKDTLSQSMQNLASELENQSLLKAQKNQLEQEVAALEKTKSYQASTAEALQQQVAQKLKELNELKDQFDEQRSSSQLREALSNAITNISGQNELNDQQRVLNNKLDDLKRQISKKQDELDDLQSQVNEQQSTNLLSETLGQAFDDLKDTLSQSMQNLASELATQSQLTAQKTQLQQEVAALEEKAKSAHTVEASNTAYEELEQTPAAIENFLEQFDGTEVKDEGTALELFQDYLKGEGFFYSPRTLKAFHTSLKVQNINPISVLAGLSGTGKTQLALQYAKFFNFYSEHVAVQPRWDSKDDLLGFYNFLEKRYQPTELVKALYYFHQIRNNSDSPMMMVILDEMNLARVEYYFSEFLSKLELRGTDRNQPEDKSKISIGTQLNSRDFFVGSNVVFVGTMNDDESTYSLSDKVLDRANVLHFGKPKSFEDNIRYDKVSPIYVNAYTFNDWCSQENFPNNFPEALRTKINTLNNALDSVGKAFGYRVNKSITHYIQMYPDIKSSANPEESALIALADQIEMKIIPKLAGLEQNEKSDNCLSSIDNEIRDTHDDELIKAFKIAKDNYETNGMFLWRGVSRSIDQA